MRGIYYNTTKSLFEIYLPTRSYVLLFGSKDKKDICLFSLPALFLSGLRCLLICSSLPINFFIMTSYQSTFPFYTLTSLMERSGCHMANGKLFAEISDFFSRKLCSIIRYNLIWNPKSSENFVQKVYCAFAHWSTTFDNIWSLRESIY